MHGVEEAVEARAARGKERRYIVLVSVNVRFKTCEKSIVV